MDNYLAIIEEALSEGIVPVATLRILPVPISTVLCSRLRTSLMELSKESGIPIKIRACDTLGLGSFIPGLCSRAVSSR